MSDKKIVLVTGGNSGIGFELCSQLLAKGSYHVLLGSRSVEKGQTAVSTLEAYNHPGIVELVELDVTNDSTIEATVQHIQSKYGKLDILVNNAGVAFFGTTEPLRKRMDVSFAANATGPAVLTEACSSLLRAASPPARIVHVSSGAASIAMQLDRNDPSHTLKNTPYRVSKSAQSMVAACQAIEFEDAGVKVFLYSPGFTESNLGPNNKEAKGAKPTAVSVVGLVDIIEGKRDGDEELNLSQEGTHPW